jgi:hypothetical protein
MTFYGMRGTLKDILLLPHHHTCQRAGERGSNTKKVLDSEELYKLLHQVTGALVV